MVISICSIGIRTWPKNINLNSIMSDSKSIFTFILNLIFFIIMVGLCVKEFNHEPITNYDVLSTVLITSALTQNKLSKPKP